MNTGYLEGKLAALPQEQRPVLLEIVRALNQLSFGAPSDEGASVAAENFGGHLVPFTTSSVANQEVAIAHELARVPRLIIPLMDPNTVGSRVVGDLEITRLADEAFVYVKSASTSVSGLLYVE